MPRLFRPWFTHLGIVSVLFAGTSHFARAAEKEVLLVFSGGHEIGKDGFGRPVALIAAGLGVKPDEFRQAFSGVTRAKVEGQRVKWPARTRRPC
jgi:hypothetical protein